MHLVNDSIQLLSSLLNSGPRYYSIGHCNPSLPVNSSCCNISGIPKELRSNLFSGSHLSSQRTKYREEDGQQRIFKHLLSNENTSVVICLYQFAKSKKLK
ncbi:unnamed protein product [Thelazia callipaeda]|uniref:Ovule protein n=1 Tax=Thelazia callipaeda TaxID=103827 RepID=A0A0N5CSA7_THECL|nr:unnamed protein product [Thelazia callipaeda]